MVDLKFDPTENGPIGSRGSPLSYLTQSASVLMAFCSEAAFSGLRPTGLADDERVDVVDGAAMALSATGNHIIQSSPGEP